LKNGKVWKLDKGSTVEDFVKKTNPKLKKQNFVAKNKWQAQIFYSKTENR